MIKVTAAEVNKLRKATGAGMMDCKKALQESEGDFDQAIDYLRKKGQKLATKRADRDAGEGCIIAKVTEDSKFGAVIILNCETDFVAKNDDFVAFTHKIADLAVAEKPADLAALKALPFEGTTVEESVTEMLGKIGEKLELSEYKTVEAECVAPYIHNGNRIATLVALNKAGFESVGKDVAMQVAAMSPIAVDESEVTDEVKQHELEIGKDIARQEGKPEAMIEKIAIGKLGKFMKDNTLVNQAFIKDSKKNVKTYLTSQDSELAVKSFIRLALS